MHIFHYLEGVNPQFFRSAHHKLARASLQGPTIAARDWIADHCKHGCPESLADPKISRLLNLRSFTSRLLDLRSPLYFVHSLSLCVFSLSCSEASVNLCILSSCSRVFTQLVHSHSNLQVFQLTLTHRSFNSLLWLLKSYPWIHHHDKIFGLSGQNSCKVKLTNSLLQHTL